MEHCSWEASKIDASTQSCSIRDRQEREILHTIKGYQLARQPLIEGHTECQDEVTRRARCDDCRSRL